MNILCLSFPNQPWLRFSTLKICCTKVLNMMTENEIQNCKKILIDEIGQKVEVEVEKYFDKIRHTVSFDKQLMSPEILDFCKDKNIPPEFLERLKVAASNPEVPSLTTEEAFQYGIKMGKMFFEAEKKLPLTLALMAIS